MSGNTSSKNMQHFKSNTFLENVKRARACVCVCVSEREREREKSGIETDHKGMYKLCIKYCLSVNKHYVTDKFQTENMDLCMPNKAFQKVM
jgi:hypothetical protein